MAQRASNTKWNGSSDASFIGFAAYPELTARAASIITGWSAVEAHLGRTFGDLIGAKQPITMSMYSAVRSAEVQRDILRTAFIELLPLRYAMLASACINVIYKASATRNRLAHWVWAVSTDPNVKAIVLVEPRQIWKHHTAQLRHMNSGRIRKKLGAQQVWSTLPTTNNDEVFLYTVNDLKTEHETVDRAWQIAELLRQIVASDAVRRRGIYRQLCAVPDLQKALKEVKKNWPRSLRSRRSQAEKSRRTKSPKPASS